MNKKSLIGIVLFLGLPFLFQQMSFNLIQQEVAFWLLFGLIILWIYLVEKRTIQSIGWKKINIKTILSGIGLGIIMFILFGVITTIIQIIGLEFNQDVAQLFADQPFAFLVLIALRAAVVEEVLFRGYAFERIHELTKSKWLAALIPVIIFMLLHLPWGVGHLVFVFIVGGLFMLTYISKRNLALIVTAHFTVDVLAMAVLPIIMEAA